MIRLTDPAQIGAALATMRTSRGLRRRALAAAAGMIEQQYGPYENGRTAPSVESLLRLADAADYDVILLPRETTAGLTDLARAIPANALAALVALAAIPPEGPYMPSACMRVGLHNCDGEWRNHDRYGILDEPGQP